MQRERPLDLLHDILGFIEKASIWASEADAISDEKTLYAILHALQYIGEAAGRLPEEVALMAPEIPWKKIRAMRNVIAHDYGGVDNTIVWKTVHERLPELKAAVTSIMTRLAEPEE